jgi:hypothetical protein
MGNCQHKNSKIIDYDNEHTVAFNSKTRRLENNRSILTDTEDHILKSLQSKTPTSTITISSSKSESGSKSRSKRRIIHGKFVFDNEDVVEMKCLNEQ